MYFTAGDQLGIRKYSAFGHLLFCVGVKRSTFFQLSVLPNVGEDGRHREREAGRKRLENDNHSQIRSDFARELDREPERSGALARGINRSQDSIKHRYCPRLFPAISARSRTAPTYEFTGRHSRHGGAGPDCFVKLVTGAGQVSDVSSITTYCKRVAKFRLGYRLRIQQMSSRRLAAIVARASITAADAGMQGDRAIYSCCL
jgi:hypothetical protein